MPTMCNMNFGCISSASAFVCVLLWFAQNDPFKSIQISGIKNDPTFISLFTFFIIIIHSYTIHSTVSVLSLYSSLFIFFLPTSPLCSGCLDRNRFLVFKAHCWSISAVNYEVCFQSNDNRICADNSYVRFRLLFFFFNSRCDIFVCSEFWCIFERIFCLFCVCVYVFKMYPRFGWLADSIIHVICKIYVPLSSFCLSILKVFIYACLV